MASGYKSNKYSNTKNLPKKSIDLTQYKTVEDVKDKLESLDLKPSFLNIDLNTLEDNRTYIIEGTPFGTMYVSKLWLIEFDKLIKEEAKSYFK